MVCTEAFAEIARSEARRRSGEDLEIAVVPHPVGHLDEAALAPIAARVRQHIDRLDPAAEGTNGA